jgi:CRISPR-associated exonuclease Cas4
MIDLPILSGIEINYYFICKKKLWWYTHGLQMEHEHDRVKLGKTVHEESYARKRKELNIDGHIVLDWREDGVIHEVKLTDKMEEAHEMQLLYYLYYLKLKGVEDISGQIDYPKLKQTKKVELTAIHEDRIKQAIKDIEIITRSKEIPKADWMRICQSCSYAELCWG